MTRSHCPKLPSVPYIRPVTVAKFIGVSSQQVLRWEKATNILRRGRGDNSKRFTRTSVERLVYFHQKATREGISLVSAWRSEQAEPQRAIEPCSTAMLSRINTEHYFSARSIANAIGVNIRTARRYRSTGKAPAPVATLLDLVARGRILPDKWNHCFINHRGNLEIYGVGEISEGEIETMRWQESLHRQHIALLERKLSEATKRIELLESTLSELRAKNGEMGAANDRDFVGRVGR